MGTCRVCGRKTGGKPVCWSCHELATAIEIFKNRGIIVDEEFIKKLLEEVKILRVEEALDRKMA
jgi:hypothetical protein